MKTHPFTSRHTLSLQDTFLSLQDTFLSLQDTFFHFKTHSFNTRFFFDFLSYQRISSALLFLSVRDQYRRMQESLDFEYQHDHESDDMDSCISVSTQMVISSALASRQQSLLLLAQPPEIIKEQWYSVGTSWGMDSSLISAAMGLYSYQTNRFLKQKTGTLWKCFSCEFVNCPGKVSFTKSRSSSTWIVAKNDPHCTSCDELAHNTNDILEIWKNRKVVSLVPHSFLALLCRPILIDNGQSLSTLEPKDVAKVLRTTRWLPPGWSTRETAQEWLTTLSWRVLQAVKTLHPSHIPLEIEPTGSIQQPHPLQAQELAYLSSFAELFDNTDPHNRVIIHRAGGRYLCSYVIFGPIRRLATHKHSTFQFDLDACHFHHPKRAMACPGQLRSVVYSDASGRYFPLMMAHETREESEESWRLFVNQFLELIPDEFKSQLGIASDRDKGLQKVLEEAATIHGFAHVYCYAHLKRNILHNVSKEQKAEAENLFQSFALSRTLSGYARAKREIEEKMPNLLGDLADSPPERWVRSHFLPQRFGITSNPIESFWNSLRVYRLREQQHVVQVFISCYEYILTKLSNLEKEHQNWKDPVSRFAARELDLRMTLWTGSYVTQQSGTSAVVYTSSGSHYQCEITSRRCTCTVYTFKPFFCPHLLRLVEHLAIPNVRQDSVPTSYQHRKWIKAFNATKDWNNLVFDFQHQPRHNDFLPPIYGGKRGRPPKEIPPRMTPRLSRSKTGLNVPEDTRSLDERIRIVLEAQYGIDPPPPPLIPPEVIVAAPLALDASSSISNGSQDDTHARERSARNPRSSGRVRSKDFPEPPSNRRTNSPSSLSALSPSTSSSRSASSSSSSSSTSSSSSPSVWTCSSCKLTGTNDFAFYEEEGGWFCRRCHIPYDPMMRIEPTCDNPDNSVGMQPSKTFLENSTKRRVKRVTGDSTASKAAKIQRISRPLSNRRLKSRGET